MRLKQMTVIIVLVLVSICFIFADDLNYSFPFRFAHSVNINADFHFEFWDTSNRKITSVVITSPGQNRLGSLVLVFNSKVVFSSIKVKFEALTSALNSQNSYDCYPYSMYLYEPDTTTIIGEGPVITSLLLSNEERVSVGELEIIDGVREFRKQSSLIEWDQRRIADFSIELDDSEVMPGSYSGYVILEFTAGS